MDRLKHERFDVWKERSQIRKQMHSMISETREQRPGENIGGLILQEKFQALRSESDIRNIIAQNYFGNHQMSAPHVCIRIINEPLSAHHDLAVSRENLCVDDVNKLLEGDVILVLIPFVINLACQAYLHNQPYEGPMHAQPKPNGLTLENVRARMS